MRKTMGTAAAILAMASTTLCACSDNSEKSLGTDNPVDTSLSLEDFAASWDGYIEAYSFPSDSGRIRIELDGQGQGTVQFGDGNALPPPTDPDAVYPPAAANDDYDEPTYKRVYEQIVYPVHETRLDDTRLRLQIDRYDAFSDWCAIQTPIYDELNDRYSCIPNTGEYDCVVEERTPIGCAKANLCGRPCVCTETSCAIEGTSIIKLDGALSDDGTQLEGSILLNDSPFTIRLTRQ
jgi:hypothetical protein